MQNLGIFLFVVSQADGISIRFKRVPLGLLLVIHGQVILGIQALVSSP